MKRNSANPRGPELRIQCEVVRRIRQHARDSMKAEVCGVLIGSEQERATVVEACIPGVKAVQGGAHVTFTQDTWEHIYAVKDREYPDSRIVGWYHSHPGFGVFLSEHDAFIHKNFFSAPKQVAWVYDPHSDEEGCFGWIGDDLTRLDTIILQDGKGGERAGETGKPEPLMEGIEAVGVPERSDNAPRSGDKLVRIVTTGLAFFVVFLAGFVVSWLLFPHFIGIAVDPRTGQPLVRPAVPAESSHDGVQNNPAPPPTGKAAQPPKE
jgi:proteasome lid subunit RPN8/RPN11